MAGAETTSARAGAHAEGHTPWREMDPLEKFGNAVGVLIGGALMLAFVGLMIGGYVFLVYQAVVESQWAFTTVHPERVCVAGERHDCMARTVGRVTEVDGRTYFAVAIDRPPYQEQLDMADIDGRRPALGARVTLERWNGRLVSIVTRHGRQRAAEWPRRIHDLLEGAVAAVFALGIAALLVVLAISRLRDKRRSRLTGSPVQT